jgi:HD-like signal output (HDOD) protein
MTFDELFSQTQPLPTIPKVVQDLINALHNENVSVSELSRKIELDQVISAKLLRLANSPYYGLNKRVASIDKAIHMLGFSTMRTLVVSVGLAGCFKNIPNVDLPVFWRHCIRVACVARALARPARVDANTAFTAGLMHAIGHLLMAIGIAQMAELNASHAIYAVDRNAIENETFGYSYAEVSAELMSRWNFAPELQVAVLNFNAPLNAEPFEALAGVLHVAVWRVSIEELGLSPEEMFDSWPEAVADKLGISRAYIESLPSPKDLTADLEVLLG